MFAWILQDKGYKEKRLIQCLNILRVGTVDQCARAKRKLIFTSAKGFEHWIYYFDCPLESILRSPRFRSSFFIIV